MRCSNGKALLFRADQQPDQLHSRLVEDRPCKNSARKEGEPKCLAAGIGQASRARPRARHSQVGGALKSINIYTVGLDGATFEFMQPLAP
jgi:hypothetical protein